MGNGRGFGFSDAWGPAGERGITDGVKNKGGHVGPDRREPYFYCANGLCLAGNYICEILFAVELSSYS